MFKLLTPLLALMYLSLPARASQALTTDNVYARIEPRLVSTFEQKPKAGEAYYRASLKSDDSRVSQLISAFPGRDGVIKQLRFEIQVCGTRETPYPEDQLKTQFIDFVAAESEAILQDQQIRIESSDINALKGSESSRQLALSKEQASMFQRLRLKRGLYKCDSSGGLGYILDVFLRKAPATK